VCLIVYLKLRIAHITERRTAEQIPSDALLIYRTYVRYILEMGKAEEPNTIDCYFCGGSMDKKHRVETERFVRVFWHCTKCAAEYWKMYAEDERSQRERKERWH
jgi:uncharacterized protein with PIN domain